MKQRGDDFLHDGDRVPQLLDTLGERFIRSGTQFSVDEFTAPLLKELSVSPDPGMALTNLLRFAEASLNPPALFNDLVQHPVLMEVLVKIFGYSQYFADILVRDPELFRWLTASDSLVRERKHESFAAETSRLLGMFQKAPRRLDALRRMYRREILRIGARDILGEADLETITRELSLLADALIDAACVVATSQLADRFPRPPATDYAVIGLGKLGGGELNYSSDIDILFVYRDEGEIELAAGTLVTFHEYFNKFVEKLVQNLSQSSTEGHLYRVDTRLRPESGAGPLARSEQSYLLYYESRGELWERQMLIKARPVAGNTEFGNAFLKKLDPFIYPRTFFQHPSESITRIKARIEAAVEGEENVKLMPGGIRDIEFIVQALQLLNGGKNPTVRAHHTLTAIARLAEAKLLSSEEADGLLGAYTHFRTLEHRLQTMQNMQTHSLPQEPSPRTALAKRMGLASADDLDLRSEEFSKSVRRVFTDVLSYATGEDKPTISSIIEGNMTETAVRKVLSGYGFYDVSRAERNLKQLLFGTSLLGTKELDMRARDSLRPIAPELFGAIGETPSPDLTLNSLAALVGGQRFPEQVYRQMQDPKFRRFILIICSRSMRFAKELVKYPLVFDTLATNAASLTRPSLSSPLPAASLVQLKGQGELRSGIRHLLGFISFDELTAELSRIADMILTSAFEDEAKRQRLKHPPLAVMALGKYGTRELSFDADLDIIFVADLHARSSVEKLERIATGIVKRMSAFSEGGRLYEIDARLRPEGKSAPLVVDKQAYAAYLRARASLWERQSLTRLRVVCGDESLAQDVLNDVKKFVYDSPFPKTWIDETVTMRRKIETRSRTQSTDWVDIKLGPGGMVDIEFAAQMLLLWDREKALHGARTTDIIDRLSPEGYKSSGEFLIGTYRWFRTVELLLRIALEERGSLLPQEHKLTLLAQLLQADSAERLLADVAGRMQTVRNEFHNLRTFLSQHSP